jgi:hypothetical protein
LGRGKAKILAGVGREEKELFSYFLLYPFHSFTSFLFFTTFHYIPSTSLPAPFFSPFPPSFF